MHYRQLKGGVKMNQGKPEVGLDEIPKDHLLVHLCNLQKLERVAEIGVFGGNLTNRVLANCPSVKKYYAVDPWKVYIESYDREPHARECKQEFWDDIYRKVLAIKDKFPEKLVIKRMESIKCARDLKREMTTDDQKFDAVYIDAIHDAPNLVNDIYVWINLVKDYGTICGHDYIKRYRNMMMALDEIFGDDLMFWFVDKSKDRYAHKNQGQGGNWWVHLTPDKKQNAIRNIKTKFSMLLLMGNQDEVQADYKIGLPGNEIKQVNS